MSSDPSRSSSSRVLVDSRSVATRAAHEGPSLAALAQACLTAGPASLADRPDRERRGLSARQELAAVSRGWLAVLAFEGAIERRFRLVADVEGDLGHAVAGRGERAGP